MENPAREQIGQKDEGTFSGFRQARKGQTYFFGTTKQIFKICNCQVKKPRSTKEYFIYKSTNKSDTPTFSVALKNIKAIDSLECLMHSKRSPHKIFSD